MSIDMSPLTTVNPLINAKGFAISKVSKDTPLVADKNSRKNSFSELFLGLESGESDEGVGVALASQPAVNIQLGVANLQTDNAATLQMQQDQIPTTVALQLHVRFSRDAASSVDLKKSLTTLDGKGLPKTQIGCVNSEMRIATETEAIDSLVAGLLDRTETRGVGLVVDETRNAYVLKPFATGLPDSSQTRDRSVVGSAIVAADALEPFVAGLLDRTETGGVGLVVDETRNAYVLKPFAAGLPDSSQTLDRSVVGRTTVAADALGSFVTSLPDTTKTRDVHSVERRVVAVGALVPLVVDLHEGGAKHAVGVLTAELQDKLHANCVDNGSRVDGALVARINVSHPERKTMDEASFNFGLVYSVAAQTGVELVSDGRGTLPELLRAKEALKSSVMEVGGGVSRGWELRQSVANVDAPLSEGSVGTANAEPTQGAYWVSGDMRNVEMTLDGVGEGSVEVSISLHGKQTHVSFRTDEDQTRAALEGSGLTLKDMFHREGLELSAVSVGFASSNLGSGAGGGQDPRQRVDFHSFKMDSDGADLNGEQSQARAHKETGSLDVFV